MRFCILSEREFSEKISADGWVAAGMEWSRSDSRRFCESDSKEGCIMFEFAGFISDFEETGESNDFQDFSSASSLDS